LLVCAQTDGAEYQTEPLRDCDEISGLTMRSIERIPFDDRDGNTQGYAHERKVAVSPVGAISTRQSARPFAWAARAGSTGTMALTIVRRKVIENAEVVLNASISISSSTFKTPEMLLVWP